MTTDTLDFPALAEAVEVLDAAPAAQPATESALVLMRRNTLAELSAVDRGIAALKADHGATDYDIKTAKGLQLAKDRRLAVREVRYKIPHTVKARKAELKEVTEALDAEAERITNALLAIENPHDANIKAREKELADEKAERERIEAERVAKHQTAIAVIRAFGAHCQQPGITAQRIQDGIAILAEQSYSAEHWQEFAVPAANAQCETLETMRVLHAQAVEREAEAARLEAQRVEQERIAAELAAEQERQRIEQARIAADQAEQQRRLDAQAAELKANADRIAAHQRRIDEIKQAATGHIGQSAATIAEAITAVAALNCTDKVFEEMAPLAQAAQASTLSVLWTIHDDAAERERIAAEAVARFNAQHAPELAIEPPVEQLAFVARRGDSPVIEAEPAPSPHRAVVEDSTSTRRALDEPEAKPVITITLGTAEPDPLSASEPEPTLALGTINERIAPLSITGAGLELLGFAPAATAKTAKLYRESDWPAIRAAMVAAITAAKGASSV